MNITIHRREFKVERRVGSYKDGTPHVSFHLFGKRGAHYFTMTNIHTGLHFVCNTNGKMPFGNKVWIKDDNGTPVVVRQ